MKVSRRDFVKIAGVAAGATASLAVSAEATSPQPERHDEKPGPKGPKRPNFLIILCDQMRFSTVYESDELKAFRTNHLPTQNLLRENGVEFTRHYTATSACSPSRASLLTGHYPSLHAVSQTYGGAKEACDPEVFWLDPNGVPTFGNYFRAAGYRTYWKGKWHISEADMYVPGTHTPLLSFDPKTGARDPDKEALYLAADRLDPYGFEGWIGPEPHGSNPLRDTASSAQTADHGRDAGYANQTVELLQQLDHDRSETPWLVVSSFLNPHDIGVFSKQTADLPVFDFTVGDDVPADENLFTEEFDTSHNEVLEQAGKPTAQASYAKNYAVWLGAIPEDHYGPWYRRFYYQLHKNLDEQMAKVMQALLETRFKDDTIVIFTSDHGEMLGAHGDLHQKMYQAYDETTRVPLIVWSRGLSKGPRTIDALSSHVDLMPTLLGLAGIDAESVRKELARNHTDALPIVGRDLSRLILGEVDPATITEPVYVMIEDDPYRGPRMGNAQGITKPPVVDPKSIETVIARLSDGSLWKYSRYFDNKQYWTSPSEPAKDVFLKQTQATPAPEYNGPIASEMVVKGTAAADEYELYDLTHDPMELDNCYGVTGFESQQQQMAEFLAQQRAQKRLTPISGVVPGQT